MLLDRVSDLEAQMRDLKLALQSKGLATTTLPTTTATAQPPEHEETTSSKKSK